MKELVTCAAAKALDARTRQRYCVSDDILMEAAAVAMTQALLADERCAGIIGREPLVALCGSGNNGGDALAVMRRLSFAGYTKLYALVPELLSETAQRRLAEASAASVAILRYGDSRIRDIIASAGLMLDGLTGVGYKHPPRAWFSEARLLLTNAVCPVVALDIPSGIEAGSAAFPVRAEATLCIEPLKAELFFAGLRPYAGRIIPVRGVFPVREPVESRAALFDVSDMSSFAPPLNAYMHKGQRGALSVFAGARGTLGAAVLAGEAASASGVGSVTMFARGELVDILAGRMTAQMVRPHSDLGERRFDAVLAGPGWGADDETTAMFDMLWDAALPLVLDAEALRLLAKKFEGRADAQRCSPLLLTPHLGEFIPLLAISSGASCHSDDALAAAKDKALYDTAAALAQAADFFNAVIVLKGAATWIARPSMNTSAVYDGCNPLLATAGSGDVLAGLAAGYTARGSSVWDAALFAVLCHGRAGAAAAEKGFYTASDLIPYAARFSEQPDYGA